MENAGGENAASGERSTDYRVCVSSKKEVTEHIERYKALLRKSLDGQAEVPQLALQTLTQELLANFEAAVQINVLVNGLPWDEAPDDEVEEEAIDLESLLDDAIVETTRRRSKYPKHIFPHVVHALKAQRKVLGLYEEAVRPEGVTRGCGEVAMMAELSAAAPVLVRQAIQVIKSISAVRRQAEGVCEVLHTKPSEASLLVHREVFGPVDQSQAACAATTWRPHNASAAVGYVPCERKSECIVGNGLSE